MGLTRTEFFGEPEFEPNRPIKMIDSAYVIVPVLLLIRMRKPQPFTRVW